MPRVLDRAVMLTALMLAFGLSASMGLIGCSTAGEDTEARADDEIDRLLEDDVNTRGDSPPVLIGGPGARTAGLYPIAEEGEWSNLSSGRARSVGMSFFERERFEEALPYFVHYTRRTPGSADAHALVGQTYMAMGQPADAAVAFAVAHDLEPFNDDYFESLGIAKAASGEAEEAVAMASNVATERQDAASFMVLGRVAETAGLLDEAETAYRRAAAIERGYYAPAQWALADLYAAIGDRRSEILRLRVLLSLLPRDEAVKARLRALDQVPGPSLALTPGSVEN